ncbi:MAG: hypothetical protein NUW37_10545 [Planctomycetes bacterium]|nr:hypothetical protein [Planctomycetota bacterium]
MPVAVAQQKVLNPKLARLGVVSIWYSASYLAMAILSMMILGIGLAASASSAALAFVAHECVTAMRKWIYRKHKDEKAKHRAEKLRSLDMFLPAFFVVPLLIFGIMIAWEAIRSGTVPPAPLLAICLISYAFAGRPLGVRFATLLISFSFVYGIATNFSLSAFLIGFGLFSAMLITSGTFEFEQRAFSEFERGVRLRIVMALAMGAVAFMFAVILILASPLFAGMVSSDTETKIESESALRTNENERSGGDGFRGGRGDGTGDDGQRFSPVSDGPLDFAEDLRFNATESQAGTPEVPMMMVQLYEKRGVMSRLLEDRRIYVRTRVLTNYSGNRWFTEFGKMETLRATDSDSDTPGVIIEDESDLPVFASYRGTYLVLAGTVFELPTVGEASKIYLDEVERDVSTGLFFVPEGRYAPYRYEASTFEKDASPNRLLGRRSIPPEGGSQQKIENVSRGSEYFAIAQKIRQRANSNARGTDVSSVNPHGQDDRATISDYELAIATLRYFHDENFVYSIDVRKPDGGLDPTLDFLQNTKKGYCQHFASATTLILRSLGLTARVAVGFAGDQFDPETQAFVLTSKDCHAWVEVHFAGAGWVRFDPVNGIPVESSLGRDGGEGGQPGSDVYSVRSEQNRQAMDSRRGATGENRGGGGIGGSETILDPDEGPGQGRGNLENSGNGGIGISGRPRHPAFDGLTEVWEKESIAERPIRQRAREESMNFDDLGVDRSSADENESRQEQLTDGIESMDVELPPERDAPAPNSTAAVREEIAGAAYNFGNALAILAIVAALAFIAVKFMHYRKAKQRSGESGNPDEQTFLEFLKLGIAPKLARAETHREFIIQEYGSMLDRLAKSEMPKEAHETPWDYARRLMDSGFDRERVYEITSIFADAKYGEIEFSQADLVKFRKLAQGVNVL